MKKEKTEKISSGLAGAFVGLILWVAFDGESLTWWKGWIAIFIGVSISIAYQVIDEQRKKPDIIIKKNEIPDETEHSEKTGKL
ncbi:MAG: hypothetical protein WC412_06560 [Candidatus Omnitrophota bacterium]|jgi:hypothetical protein